MSRHRWVDPTAGRVTFNEYAKEWLANLRPRTVELYRSQLKCHLYPAFGDIVLIAISKRDVRTWHAGLVQSRSEITAAKCYRLLAVIMNTTVDDELIPSSPCRIKGAAVERSTDRPLVTIEEAYALADAIEPRYRALILLASFCGLRLGELLGLTRTDVDLLHRKLSVPKQQQEVGDGGVVFMPPKTAVGVRSVSIPVAIVPDLEEHLARWAEVDPICMK